MDGGICMGGGGTVTGGGADDPCAEEELDSVPSPFDSSVRDSFSGSDSSSDDEGDE